MFNHAVPNYKNPHPLVITLQMCLYPDGTLGELIKKWSLEQELFQGVFSKGISLR